MRNKVSRRTLLKTLGSLPVAAAATARTLDAQRGRPPAPAAAPAQPTAPAAPAPLRKLAIVSRHLEWASMEEGAAAAAEAGFDAIAWTCRSAAHILPENVERELPRAVEIAKQN